MALRRETWRDKKDYAVSRDAQGHFSRGGANKWDPKRFKVLKKEIVVPFQFLNINVAIPFIEDNDRLEAGMDNIESRLLLELRGDLITPVRYVLTIQVLTKDGFEFTSYVSNSIAKNGKLVPGKLAVKQVMKWLLLFGVTPVDSAIITHIDGWSFKTETREEVIRL